MLTQVQAGGFTVSGVSVGGVYTSLLVSELNLVLDVGIAPRSFVGAPDLFLSHGHADHLGALVTLLGIRGLNKAGPLRIFLPVEIADDLVEGVQRFTHVQGRGLPIEFVGLSPGAEVLVREDLWVRAVRTLHTVPSLGYVFFRRVRKLKPEYFGLAGQEIRERRESGEELTFLVDRPELAYATDTLIEVLEREKALRAARVLILECTFLDERKSRAECREKCHIHLDDIVDRAELLENEHIVLMHFSQLYRPNEVRDILKRRLPPGLVDRVIAFCPDKGPNLLRVCPETTAELGSEGGQDWHPPSRCRVVRSC
jgi:ribonuclease Z